MTLPPKIKGGSARPVSAIPFFPMGRHQVETLGVGVFSPTAEPRATYILVQAIAQNVRFTIDSGQPPTAIIGFQLVAGDPPLLIPASGNRLVRFLREANGAILQYQYGRA